jgi:hypothetical protein
MKVGFFGEDIANGAFPKKSILLSQLITPSFSRHNVSFFIKNYGRHNLPKGHTCHSRQYAIRELYFESI